LDYVSVEYSFSPMNKKPVSKRPRSGVSKYEPIITAFLKSGHDLVRVDSADKSANYLAMQLRRVCKLKGYDSVKASNINGEVFLEII